MEPLFENKMTLSLEFFLKAGLVYNYRIKKGRTVFCTFFGIAMSLYFIVVTFVTWPSSGYSIRELMIHLLLVAPFILFAIWPYLRIRRTAHKMFNRIVSSGLPLEVIRTFTDEGMTTTTAQSTDFQTYAQVGSCFFIRGMVVFDSGIGYFAMEMDRFTMGDPEDFEEFLRTKMRVK